MIWKFEIVTELVYNQAFKSTSQYELKPYQIHSRSNDRQFLWDMKDRRHTRPHLHDSLRLRVDQQQSVVKRLGHVHVLVPHADRWRPDALVWRDARGSGTQLFLQGKYGHIDFCIIVIRTLGMEERKKITVPLQTILVQNWHIFLFLSIVLRLGQDLHQYPESSLSAWCVCESHSCQAAVWWSRGCRTRRTCCPHWVLQRHTGESITHAITCTLFFCVKNSTKQGKPFQTIRLSHG